MIAVCMSLLGLITAGLGIVPTLLAYLILDLCNGMVVAFVASPTYTLMQKESDASMQGRVLGLLISVSAFGVPAGMLVFGPLADVVDVRLLFVVGGLMTVPIGAYVMRSARRNRVAE